MQKWVREAVNGSERYVRPAPPVLSGSMGIHTFVAEQDGGRWWVRIVKDDETWRWPTSYASAGEAMEYLDARLVWCAEHVWA